MIKAREDQGDYRVNGKAVSKREHAQYKHAMTTDPMDQYMRNVEQYPRIDKNEEARLSREIRQGSKSALLKLIRANLRLVVKIAHNYKGRGLPLIDLVCEGNLALARAAKSFDPNKGAKFSSYSAWWIKGAMNGALNDQVPMVRVSPQRAVKIKRVQAEEKKFIEENGRGPTRKELAARTGYTERTLKHLGDFQSTCSLNDPIDDDGDRVYGDIIPDNTVPSIERLISIDEVSGLVAKLSEKEIYILTEHFGLNGKGRRKLKDIAKDFNQGLANMSLIKVQALKKLRKLAEAQHE